MELSDLLLPIGDLALECVQAGAVPGHGGKELVYGVGVMAAPWGLSGHNAIVDFPKWWGNAPAARGGAARRRFPCGQYVCSVRRRTPLGG
ncbi:hypothetical protein PDTK01_36390 [Phycicoccus sp. DTK01]|nr:hypothetical protein PDTK01_36390 [Phycicoccus sp. DTK01]